MNQNRETTPPEKTKPNPASTPKPPTAPDWRGRFPFSIGAPSWVFPFVQDNLLSNVRYLSRSVDRVQLLLFGKDYLDEMLIPADLSRLAQLRQETGLRYSIHLPSDLHLLDRSDNPAALDWAMTLISRIRQETQSLEPESFILHIDGKRPLPNLVEPTGKRCMENVLAALTAYFPDAPARILIENTSDDLRPFRDLFVQAGFGICADFGHLWHRKYSIPEFVDCLGPLVREIHLHGFNDSGDHLALDQLDARARPVVSSFLTNFRGPVTLEIFQAEFLWPSLELLSRYLEITT